MSSYRHLLSIPYKEIPLNLPSQDHPYVYLLMLLSTLDIDYSTICAALISKSIRLKALLPSLKLHIYKQATIRKKIFYTLLQTDCVLAKQGSST